MKKVYSSSYSAIGYKNNKTISFSGGVASNIDCSMKYHFSNLKNQLVELSELLLKSDAPITTKIKIVMAIISEKNIRYITFERDIMYILKNY